VVQRAVVEEVALDHVAPVSQGQDEMDEALSGIDFHHVPENRPAADLDQHLGPLVPHADAHSAAENDDGDEFML